MKPSEVYYKVSREWLQEYCRIYNLRVVGFREPEIGEKFLNSLTGMVISRNDGMAMSGKSPERLIVKEL